MDESTAVEVQKASPLDQSAPVVPARRAGRPFPAANSLATAMALSVSAGYLDGFTYVGHGRVFASAMTGNMVLLGIHLAGAKSDSLIYVFPILAYVAGSIVAHVMMRDGVRARFGGRPHVVTLLLEIAVLTGIAVAPFKLGDRLLVPIITVATSMQNTSFRNIGTRTYNSVIMTGNLQTFSNALAAGLRPFTPARLVEARDLGAVLGSFLAGAALGALLTPRLGLDAVLVPAGILGLGCLVLLSSRDA